MKLSMKLAPLALAFTAMALPACKPEQTAEPEETLAFSCDMPDLSTLSPAMRADQALLPATIFITTSNLPEKLEGEEVDLDAPVIPEQNALGSGFTVDSSGYILTNHHVIDDAARVFIELFDRNFENNKGMKYPAQVIASDATLDLAVLKVDTGAPLPCVKLGDSDNVFELENVTVIGGPLGRSFSASTGVISNNNAELNNQFYRYLQTDAAINRGNSGGPLFNEAGEVIGMNTAILSPNGASIGLGFATRSNDIKKAAHDLITLGYVRLAGVGMRMEPVSETLAKEFGIEEHTGVVVIDVTEGGPAERSGLLPADIILSINGQDIKSFENPMRKALRMITHNDIDDVIEAEIIRNGEMLTIDIELDDRKKVVSAPVIAPPAPTVGPQ